MENTTQNQKMTLKEILYCIQLLLESDPDELTPEQEENTKNALEELRQLEAEKVDAVCGLIKQYDGQINACEEEGKRLIAKAKGIERRRDNLKNFFAFTLREAGKTFEKGSIYEMRIRKSERVDVPDMELLPKEYVKVKTEYSPDKIAIKKAINEGKIVKGVILTQCTSLNIK